MTTHTPGPWEFIKGFSGIRIQSTKICREIYSPGRVSDADARLIAAAPEMLDFIKSLAHLTGADALTQRALLARIEGKETA